MLFIIRQKYTTIYFIISRVCLRFMSFGIQTTTQTNITPKAKHQIKHCEHQNTIYQQTHAIIQRSIHKDPLTNGSLVNKHSDQHAFMFIERLSTI